MKTFPFRTLLLLLAVLAAIVVPFLLFGDTLEAHAARLAGQAGNNRPVTALLLALLLATDILLPIPSSLVSTACGATLGLAAGAGASFLGMSLSTAAGYALGRYASGAAARLLGPRERERLAVFQRRHGAWMLLALRPVPVLAEASVLFSGLSRQPPVPVLLAASLGNAAVSLVYAAVGSWGQRTDATLAAFGVVIALTGVLMLALNRCRPEAPRPRP